MSGCQNLECKVNRAQLKSVESSLSSVKAGHRKLRKLLEKANKRIQELEVLATNFLYESHHNDGCRPNERAMCICGKDDLEKALSAYDKRGE